jgi:AcrR family transcriptional regulator
MGGSAATEPMGTRSTRGEVTRRQLIDSAIETLKDRGFAGASARVIADRAGINQGLIFYHFGSVTGLLLAALDAVSATRQARYGEAVGDVSSPSWWRSRRRSSVRIWTRGMWRCSSP